MFKWGSLVGISPAGTAGVDFDSSVKTYTPEYNSGTSPSWNTTNSYANFHTGIPYIDYEVPGTWDKHNTYLIDDERNTPEKWNAKTGDICRYISENGYGPGGNYRLPIGYEFGLTDGTLSYGGASGWTKMGASTWSTINTMSETYADGSYPMANGASNSGFFFPASGNRVTNEISEGKLHTSVGTNGFYWSGSVGMLSVMSGYTSRTCHSLSFSDSWLRVDEDIYLGGPTDNLENSAAYPVRCVKY
jgi:hypothetical protein